MKPIHQWLIGLFALFSIMFASALPAAAHTARETQTCVQAGLASVPFTGKLSPAHKLRKARHLAVGQTVVVNGASVKLEAGQSLWSLCAGPSLIDGLKTENASLRKQLGDARGAAYYWAKDAKGHEYLSTYKGLAELRAHDREAALGQRDHQHNNAVWSFWTMIVFLLASAILGIFLWIAIRNYNRDSNMIRERDDYIRTLQQQLRDAGIQPRAQSAFRFADTNGPTG